MKCAVLVSGGVDSSVALKLLQEAGYQVTAFYIKIWLEDELSFLGSCPWQEDLTYVQAVCEKLKVPLTIISLQREYWDRVVAYTIKQVYEGKTPNPDVLCNQQIKFGAFLDAIDESYQKIATGHYAALQESEEGVSLMMSADPVKDQTYFLAYLTQKQLSRALFPLGPYTKQEVRLLAGKFDLPTKDRKDSQGICFLGTIKFDQFLEYHLGTRSGLLIELETKRCVGTHKGFWFYTIGQRKGIGLSGGPWYVVGKNAKDNIIYVSRSYYADDKARNIFKVIDCNWLGKPPSDKAQLTVKMRHGAQFHKALISYQPDAQSLLVTLDSRDQGIASGQFAVFYEGKKCLGAGIIESIS